MDRFLPSAELSPNCLRWNMGRRRKADPLAALQRVLEKGTAPYRCPMYWFVQLSIGSKVQSRTRLKHLQSIKTLLQPSPNQALFCLLLEPRQCRPGGWRTFQQWLKLGHWGLPWGKQCNESQGGLAQWRHEGTENEKEALDPCHMHNKGETVLLAWSCESLILRGPIIITIIYLQVTQGCNAPDFKPYFANFRFLRLHSSACLDQ